MKQWKFGEWRIAEYSRNYYVLQHIKCEGREIHCKGREIHDCYLAKNNWKCNERFGCGKKVPKEIQLLADLFFCDNKLFYRKWEIKK